MPTSDIIALIATCFAGLSALYARQSSEQARQANQIAARNALKPGRLAAFTALVDFLHFCSTYRTLQSMGKVKDTTALVARLERFKWEAAQRNHLDMPEVEKVTEKTCAKAWQLQRTLDRLGEPNAPRMELDCIAEDDKLDELVDWFVAQEKEATALFEPYLKITQQPDCALTRQGRLGWRPLRSGSSETMNSRNKEWR